VEFVVLHFITDDINTSLKCILSLAYRWRNIVLGIRWLLFP